MDQKNPVSLYISHSYRLLVPQQYTAELDVKDDSMEETFSRSGNFMPVATLYCIQALFR